MAPWRRGRARPATRLVVAALARFFEPGSYLVVSFPLVVGVAGNIGRGEAVGPNVRPPGDERFEGLADCVGKGQVVAVGQGARENARAAGVEAWGREGRTRGRDVVKPVGPLCLCREEKAERE